MKSKLLLIPLFTLIIGCTTSKKVTTTLVEPVKVAPEVLSQGKELCENKCAKCHKLFAASDYSLKQWPKIMDRMQTKARITYEQKAQILAYLSVGAKQ